MSRFFGQGFSWERPSDDIDVSRSTFKSALNAADYNVLIGKKEEHVAKAVKAFARVDIAGLNELYGLMYLAPFNEIGTLMAVYKHETGDTVLVDEILNLDDLLSVETLSLVKNQMHLEANGAQIVAMPDEPIPIAIDNAIPVADEVAPIAVEDLGAAGIAAGVAAAAVAAVAAVQEVKEDKRDPDAMTEYLERVGNDMHFAREAESVFNLESLNEKILTAQEAMNAITSTSERFDAGNPKWVGVDQFRKCLQYQRDRLSALRDDVISARASNAPAETFGQLLVLYRHGMSYPCELNRKLYFHSDEALLKRLTTLLRNGLIEQKIQPDAEIDKVISAVQDDAIRYQEAKFARLADVLPSTRLELASDQPVKVLDEGEPNTAAFKFFSAQDTMVQFGDIVVNVAERIAPSVQWEGVHWTGARMAEMLRASVPGSRIAADVPDPIINKPDPVRRDPFESQQLSLEEALAAKEQMGLQQGPSNISRQICIPLFGCYNVSQEQMNRNAQIGGREASTYGVAPAMIDTATGRQI